MEMDTFLSLFLPPQKFSGSFNEDDGDTGLPVVGSHSVRLVVMGLVYGTSDVGNGDQAPASILASKGSVAKCNYL